ncbi:hypothetical protein BU24DRAFT_167305 [Aaosphaeria arxii CBS 175.79]|uniref:Uncharacterized protein n=1 Tax=Aaosphaeria arxii CBS 175.79 TaxID=1450172 RepID=A0A6A5XYG4_9PLEO|nr:uncharacterized protein BU24DRAFT_167305 [Aaosphaeria arxii CBS 175.79]KAF2018212.1 hypothetical protein BU24DRAFT_167305 [Aaosphaeria arxii CBS 175.79]
MMSLKGRVFRGAHTQLDHPKTVWSTEYGVFRTSMSFKVAASKTQKNPKRGPVKLILCLINGRYSVHNSIVGDKISVDSFRPGYTTDVWCGCGERIEFRGGWWRASTSNLVNSRSDPGVRWR